VSKERGGGSRGGVGLRVISDQEAKEEEAEELKVES
jgi:hypothetical protein